MKSALRLLRGTLGAALLWTLAPALTFGQDVPIDRTVLPIRQPTYPPITELDARNVKPRLSWCAQRPHRTD